MLRPRHVLLVLVLALIPASASGLPDSDLDHAATLLVDPSADVEYAPGFVGPRDRTYLDIESVEMAYTNATDDLTLVLRVADAHALAAPAPEWSFSCEAYLRAYADGDRVQSIGFGVSRRPGEVALSSSVRWIEVSTAGPVWSFEGESVPIRHRFQASMARPGLFEFHLPRSSLTAVADKIGQPFVNCGEWFQPATGADALLNNYDEASSSGSFELQSLTPRVPPSDEGSWQPSGPTVASLIGLVVLAKAVIGWRLYARLGRDKVMDNPHRARICEVLERDPGIHHRRLMRATGLAPGALAHHLYMLERAGLVRKTKHRSFTHYCLVRTNERALLVASALRAPTARWIVEELQRTPGLTATVLARARRVHPSTILHHLRGLMQAGVVVRTRTRSGFELRIAESLKTMGAPAMRDPQDRSAAAASS